MSTDAIDRLRVYIRCGGLKTGKGRQLIKRGQNLSHPRERHSDKQGLFGGLDMTWLHLS